MSRFMMFGAAAFAALVSNPVATAVAQVDGDAGITVTGPRSRITDQSGSLLNVYKVSDSTHVYYGDLDLRTLAGRDELRYRVRLAAMRSCNRLDTLHWSDTLLSEQGACMTNAVANARAQVSDAVARYGE